jgi:hypothetical protein
MESRACFKAFGTARISYISLKKRMFGRQQNAEYPLEGSCNYRKLLWFIFVMKDFLRGDEWLKKNR